MDVLVMCPSKVATGGVESLHKFAYELNKIDGMNVKMWYVGERVNPQPAEYACYNMDYVTSFPKDYRDVIIVPEIWANNITDGFYRNCIVAVDWAGVDVYYWNNEVRVQGQFLKRRDAFHLSQMQYAVDHLTGLGVNPDKILRISDVLHEDFYAKYKERERNNVILYNPVKVTDYQKAVMNKARDEGLMFKPIENMTRKQVIQTLRQAKLYLDLGVFSGRERIPREAAMCGCCVITSRTGAAAYYEDVSIIDKYRFDTDSNNILNIIKTMKYILNNYDACKSEFDTYRQSVIHDRDILHSQCETVAKAFLGVRR